MHLETIICEAKSCSAQLGAKHANAFKYGEVTNELKYNYLKLNGFIRTLCRNKKVVKYKKEVKPLKTVDISFLEKKNNYLSLRHKETVVCTKQETSPCLSDSDLRHIIEQIRLLCSTLNCNCK